MYTIMVFGGHSGDDTYMTGALAHKYASRGHRVVFVAMTQGAGGHFSLPPEEYKIQKMAEHEEAGRRLGIEIINYDSANTRAEFTVEDTRNVADILRKYCPDCVLTHWDGRGHRDHVATHYNVLYGIREAADPNYVTDLEPYKVPELLFAENNEDPEGFNPNVFVTVDEEDIAAWEYACNSYQSIREGFYNRDYFGYYKSLFRIRGEQAPGHVPYANALYRKNTAGVILSDSLPGCKL